MITYTRWPEDLARQYRQKGYWLDLPLTRILTDTAKRLPQSTAIICGERHISYQALNQFSDNLAAKLAAQGLGIGDTALVQLPNSDEFYIVFFALLKAGIVPLNALYNHRQHELTSFFSQIKPRLLIASRSHEVFIHNDFLNQLTSQQLAPSLTLMLNAGSGDRNLSDWYTSPPATGSNYAATRADEVAFFQLSGGSTGTPKLIPRTHNDYDYSVRASAEICGLNQHTRLLCAMPAPHNYMLSSPGALGVFHAGGCVVMAANPEPSSCFALIEQHQLTMASLVPSAVAMWMQQPAEQLAKVRSLQLIQVGGASFPESMARQVLNVFGCQLQQVFGMAEGLVNYTRLDDSEEVIITTQGRPISPDDEVRVVDENGHDVPDGETGMLKTRGPYTFRGYYQSPEYNAQAFDTEGFYHSGDLVQRNSSGYLKVVGRIKDQINRGGEKIAAEEIEKLIITHPDVTEAALVAISDERFGEKSCAFIVSQNQHLTALSLKRHLLNLGIAHYKLPDQVCIVDSLPLTAVGKTDKKRLRETLQQSPA
ncbi:(2,3-dihydroxybenzoyl)adenylate synthase [Snodgrassella gandavensis]|uniref:(2,3-dihydroxybenzoyl)adenylate synthase n=1 Tax=Snodgrassella gandavensis TaxID=2946698 RepID=UPI001EF5FC67|nr:(2,3-dihydroxybenzoyl)adenylate synthase [Snodgrassella gandavensis]